jgi:glycosyltransferase involved in cell wall biosynthesis
VYPGIQLSGLGPRPTPKSADEPLTIGYLARIAPEKGLLLLAQAVGTLEQSFRDQPWRLRFAGWLGEHNRKYFDEVRQTLQKYLPADRFEHVEVPNRASKISFLQSLDVLSVPTPYREPKGLYILESLACGVPVVQPNHGSFPELIEATGGGICVKPNDLADLANGLQQMLSNAEQRREFAQRGHAAVQAKFSAEVMAQRTVEVLQLFRNTQLAQ